MVMPSDLLGRIDGCFDRLALGAGEAVNHLISPTPEAPSGNLIRRSPEEKSGVRDASTQAHFEIQLARLVGLVTHSLAIFCLAKVQALGCR